MIVLQYPAVICAACFSLDRVFRVIAVRRSTRLVSACMADLYEVEHTTRGNSRIMLLRTFKYRREVHSANFNGKVDMELCDNASLLEVVYQQNSYKVCENRAHQPLEFNLDDVYDLLGKLFLNAFVTEVERNTRLESIADFARLSCF